jgi:hypothetical protein
MGVVAALLIGFGIIAIIYGLIMRRRVSRVSDAPFAKTGEIAQKGSAVASPKGAISAEGNVTCPQPIVSPVTGTTCLFYELEVTQEWKDGDTTKTKTLTKEKRAAQFAIDDGSGPVWIDAREGGDFEPQQKKEETKSTGLLGGITGQELVFGNYRLATGMLSLGSKYKVEEKVLPAVPKLYVCGKLGSSNEIMQPGGLSSLLITNKSRTDYLGHALASFKYAMMGGGGGIVVGIILGVVASMMGGDDAKAKTASTATATATAAAADTGTAAAGDTAAPGKAGTPTHAGGPTKPATTTAPTATHAAATATAATHAPTAAPTSKPSTTKKK